MVPPANPADEASRLTALRCLNILDTPAEERFDRIARLACRLFDVPIALVSLVDENRQWFKSRVGLAAAETSRDVSFCSHAIAGDDIMVINDAAADLRFADNPLVTHKPFMRFYAGCPLKVAGGSRVGTLCVIDRLPRTFDADDLRSLRDLAAMVEHELGALHLATTDELTLLPNRRGFAMLAQHALAMSTRLGRPATLFYLDLDGFKSINDRMGHAAGDRALRGFASVLASTFRGADVVGRLSGDEFVALATDCGPDRSRLVPQRIQAALDRHNAAAREGCEIRFSVGAAAYDPKRHTAIDALLADADAAMLQNKRRRQTG